MSTASLELAYASSLTPEQQVKEKLAQRYWEVSLAYSKRPNPPRTMIVGTMISEMTNLAGRSQYIWDRLENRAASRLDDIIQMRRSRKTTVSKLEALKVVALHQVTAIAIL